MTITVLNLPPKPKENTKLTALIESQTFILCGFTFVQVFFEGKC